jgi:hypothetical protein
MARDREREAWDQIESCGTQGDGTFYRLKGGQARLFFYDKAAIEGTELLKALKKAEAKGGVVAAPPPPPDAGCAWLLEAPGDDFRPCGAFSEDTNGVRIADSLGRSVLILDNDLRELIRLCARRVAAAREAERKAAEQKVAALRSQLEAAQAKAEKLR